MDNSMKGMVPIENVIILLDSLDNYILNYSRLYPPTL